MNAFATLFRTPRPMINGRLAEDVRSIRFPDVVANSSKLHLWKPGEPIQQTGTRLLIGVATWSEHDLALLDLIETNCIADPVHIDVFDADCCRNPGDFQVFIPDLGAIHHSPVVGAWINGSLSRSAVGHEARLLVAQICGLDVRHVEQAA